MSQTSNEKNWFEKVVDSAGDIASKVGEGVGNIAGKVGDGVGEIVDKIGDEIKEIKEKREEKEREKVKIQKDLEAIFSPSNFIDRGSYIELVCPHLSINRIEKTVNLERLTWNESLKYARNLKLGGFSNWRLPKIEELVFIYNIKEICRIEDLSDDFWSYTTGRIGYNDAHKFNDEFVGAKFNKINLKSMENIYCYISSCNHVDYSTYACILGFHNGKVSSLNKSESRYVRCVQ